MYLYNKNSNMKNKLFLEEGEISRILNMHKRAINEELNINGREVGNKRGILNEITEDEKLTADGVGTKIQALYKFCNVGIPGLAHVKCATDMNAQLKLLKTKEQFDIAGKKTSYWYTGDWARSLGDFLKQLMKNGVVSQLSKTVGTPQGEMAIKIAQIYASTFKVAGGTLTFKKVNDANGNPTLDPESFKLSWGTPAPIVGGGAAPVVTTNNAACDKEGFKLSTNNSWYFSTKETYDAAPADKRRAWTCSLDKNVILYWVDRVWHDTVYIKTKGKSGGSGTGGGTGGGGRTGTRKKYTFDVAAVNKLIDEKCSKDKKPNVGSGGIDLDVTGTQTQTPIPNMPTDQFNTL
jgi:hypothetical protein